MAIRDLRNLSVALPPKMSALPPKADIGERGHDVRFGPIADIGYRCGGAAARWLPPAVVVYRSSAGAFTGEASA